MTAPTTTPGPLRRATPVGVTMAVAVAILAICWAQPSAARDRAGARQAADQALAADTDRADAPADAHQRSPGEVSKITQTLSQQIYSPFCPGKTLAMCPSGGASEVRQHIQTLARRGMDQRAIKEDVIATYGEEFRMVEPPAQDNYMLFGAIAALLGLCLTAIYWVARRRASDVQPHQDGGSDDDELSAQERVYLDELRGEYRD